MQFGVLITDHGKHSDTKLAIACATDIIQIGADASGKQAIDGRKLENNVIEVIEASFKRLSDYEHAEIAAKGTAHLTSMLDAHPEIKADTVSGVMKEIAASPLAEWFNNDATKGNVTNSVDKWLRNAQHMHRDWYARHGKVGTGTDLKAADNHKADCPHVARWVAMHTGGDLKAISEHNQLVADAAA